MAEINDPGTLHAALHQLMMRAGNEHADAEIEQRCVLGDLALLERIIANARASGMSGAAIAAVEHVADPVNRLAAAAMRRRTATGAKVAAAEAAVAVAARHVALQAGQAGGRFYQHNRVYAST